MTTQTHDGEPQTPAAMIIQDAIALNDVATELQRARRLFGGTFASAHEGYAVILEELDELKEFVFEKRETRNRRKMRAEAVQVAAMALRFAFDVTPLSEQK